MALALLPLATGLTAGAAFVTVPEQLPRDRRPDTVRRERCDTLVVARAIVNPKPVARAVWRTTALGVYETYVNGVADCAQAMKPGYTNAARRRQEMTWTIGEGLKRGAGETNVFAARVTCGWWRDRVIDWHGGSFDDTAFRGSLTLTYADGTTETFLTDPTWKAAYAGQVVHADIYYGETVDARISEAFLTDPQVLAAWTNAVVCDSFKGEITPLAGAGVCRREDLALKPVAAYVWKGADGAEGTNVFGRVRRVRTFQPGEALVVEPGETLVVDFGQNASATPDFAFSAAEGTRLTVNFAEMLNDANGERSRGNDGPAGSAYLASMRSCPSQFDYVFAGRGVERCRPSFSFWGYRYLTARATGRVEIRSLRSVPVTSVTREMERGTLVTGDAAVNRLLSNVRWGMLSNYLSVPTDCPQRDERQGWAADTQVFTRTGLYLADVYPFFMKWMRDVTDTQRPNGLVRSVAPGLPPKAGETKPETQHIGWADAIVIVPWTNWRMSGDPAIVKANWEPMTRFVDLVASSRYATPEGAWQHADWLSYEKVKGEYKDFCAWWRFLGNCYICLDARMMAEMADVAAPSERARFERMAAEALGYLRANFLTADGDIREAFHDLQTAHLFALKVGLAPTDAAKRRIRDRLLALIRRNGDRLSTGFLGTSVLMDTLTEEAAAPEVAYTLLLQHENPSWLYSVDQGATTIWERWNGYTREKGFGPVGMNSFNHYAYGAVVAWLYGTAAGIRPGPRGGFDEFVLAPVPDARLGSVDASFRTPKGTIRSSWKYENGVCRWTYTVPEGATALVRVNGREERRTAGTYGQELSPLRFSNGTVGTYESPVRKGDFGRDAFGWLEVRSETSGACVLRLGERLLPDGGVDVKPEGTIRGCEVRCRAGREWTRVPLEPNVRNTKGANGAAIAVALPAEVGTVMPFRYVQKIEGPEDLEMRRVFVHWPMERRVRCPTDDAAMRELWDFCQHTMVATSFAGLMVDGDRERIPYEGDIYINMMGQLYGMDGDPELARRSIRHVLKHPTWPTEWSQHAIMCVWEDWRFTGSTALAAECYDRLKREKLMLERARPDGLLSSDASDIVDWPVGERDGYQMKTPCNAVVNAFHYRNLREMSDLARALGRSEDVQAFAARAEKVKARFNELFYDAGQGLYVDGEGSRHASLHANVAALDFSLVPESRQKTVLDFIAGRGMACSPYFAQYYLEALCRFGRKDVARRLMVSRDERSWLGMVDQGATMAMEAWNLRAKPNLDWNHAWGAAPLNIIARFFR